MNEKIIVFAFSVALLLICALFEFRRANRRRLAGRLLAVFILVFSLLCLYLRPTIPTKKTSEKGSGKVLLLTEGFSPDSLARFPEGTRLYSADEKLIRNFPALKIRPVFSVEDWKTENSTVHIFGYGPDSADFANLADKQIVFHPSPEPGGIQKAAWTEKIRQGEAFRAGGSFKNRRKTAVKIVLNGSGTNLDSVQIPADSTVDFQLKTEPKIEGRGVFRLIAISGKDTLENAPLPFVAGPKQKLSLLMLASAPGFENRFIKNWLAEEGYALALRSTISKDKITQEFVNRAKTSLKNITQNMLAETDVLIADAGALRTLSPAENLAVQNAVQKGMGLLVKTDTAAANPAFILRYFSLFSVVHPQSNGELFSPGKIARAKLPGSRLAIRPSSSAQILFTDKQENALAALTLSGIGKIVLSTLPETYPLMLSGEKKAYSSIWTILISSAARSSGGGAESLVSAVQFPRVDEPVPLDFRSERDTLPQIRSGNTKIPMAQSADLPYIWSGIFWPEKPGWTTFRSAPMSLFHLYFFDRQDFAAVRAIETQKRTRAFVEKQANDQNRQNISEKAERKLFPVFVYFALMLISLAFLWIERKLA
ncbi:MAG: hypothetical protein INR69_09185 [Mucilaginibacter polytrichastri]|nr:hypothetical protein [Mucilaginibacter polytrichastri]